MSPSNSKTEREAQPPHRKSCEAYRRLLQELAQQVRFFVMEFVHPDSCCRLDTCARTYFSGLFQYLSDTILLVVVDASVESEMSMVN